jgi:lysozyme
MKTSTKGKIALAVSEGIVDTPYLDSKGIWTVGIGVTKAAGDIDPVKFKGRVFTIQEIFDQFDKVLVQYENAVNELVKVPILQHEYDALVHFVYNVGRGGFAKSKLLKLINEGKKTEAWQTGFHGWVKPAELRSRRDRERAIAQKGDYGPTRAPLYGVNSNYKPVSKGSVDVALELAKPAPKPTIPVSGPSDSVITPITPDVTEKKTWISEILSLIKSIFLLFTTKRY